MSRGSFQVNLFPYNLRSKCGSERYFLVKSRSIDFGWRRRLLTDEAMANSDLSGLIAILGYVAVAAGIVLYQAFTSGCGWRAWVLHKADRFYIGLMWRPRMNRRCPFPEDGPVLFIVNHRSTVDPAIAWYPHHLVGTKRRVRTPGYLATQMFCDMPGIVGWTIAAQESIPVDDQAGHNPHAIHTALRRLRDGKMVGIFPEGRINRGPGILPGNPGVAYLAIRARVPVFPIYLENVPVSESYLRPFFMPRRVRITFGDAIDLSEYEGRLKDSAALQEATGKMMQALADLGGVEVQPRVESVSAPPTPVLD